MIMIAAMRGWWLLRLDGDGGMMLYSDDFVVSVVCFESSSYLLMKGTSRVCDAHTCIPASLSKIFVCMCAIEGGKLKIVGASSLRWYRGKDMIRSKESTFFTSSTTRKLAFLPAIPCFKRFLILSFSSNALQHDPWFLYRRRNTVFLLR